MATPDPVKCLQVIKLLQKKIEDLKIEKNKALETQSQLNEELSSLYKKYNDVLQEKESLSEAVKSNLKQNGPVSDNNAMVALTNQNLALRNELTKLQGSEHVQGIVKISSLKEVIDQCKQTIASKNDQIALLQKQTSQAELMTKVNKLQQLLKKTKHVNQTYARHIETLQDQLNSLSTTDNQEKSIETVSGDQDLSTLGHLNTSGFEEEIQELKTRVQMLSDKSHEAHQKLKESQTIEETLKAHNTLLENENRILTKQNLLLSTSSASDFPIDSQMKTFYDDFNEERSEKEKQWKENQEIKGENTRLKQKLDKLTAELDRQHQTEEKARQMMSPGILHSPPPLVHNQPPPYDERSYQRSMFNMSYPPTAPSVESSAYMYPQHDPAIGQPAMRQVSYPSAGHGGLSMRQEVPQRKIGFGGPGPQARPPRPNSSQRQPAAHTPSYQSPAMAQPHRPPQSRQPYHPQMSLPAPYMGNPPNHPNFYQQPHSISYQPSTIQSDVAFQQDMDELLQASEKKAAGES